MSYDGSIRYMFTCKFEYKNLKYEIDICRKNITVWQRDPTLNGIHYANMCMPILYADIINDILVFKPLTEDDEEIESGLIVHVRRMFKLKLFS